MGQGQPEGRQWQTRLPGSGLGGPPAMRWGSCCRLGKRRWDAIQLAQSPRRRSTHSQIRRARAGDRMRRRPKEGHRRTKTRPVSAGGMGRAGRSPDGPAARSCRGPSPESLGASAESVISVHAATAALGRAPVSLHVAPARKVDRSLGSSPAIDVHRTRPTRRVL